MLAATKGVHANSNHMLHPMRQDIVLDFCDKEKTHQRLLRSAIQTWLKPRASSVKTLTLKYGPCPVAFQTTQIPHRPLPGTALGHLHSWPCRNSSLDPTHSFSRDGNPLREIFASVGTSLTSLQVENCNDIFNQSALEDLQFLTQLTRLHITNVRQRYTNHGFDSLSCLTSLQVNSTKQVPQSLATRLLGKGLSWSSVSDFQHQY